MIEEVVAKLSTAEQILMFVAGVLFVATQRLARNKHWATWYVGLAGNAVWYAVVVVGQNWALLLLVVAMTWVNTKNLLVWRREAQSNREEAVGWEACAIRHHRYDANSDRWAACVRKSGHSGPHNHDPREAGK